ncbi:MAG: MFS transporter [Acidobacteria bacterium]|nr:MFS transporter [Acidobacteriota bacterium]
MGPASKNAAPDQAPTQASGNPGAGRQTKLVMLSLLSGAMMFSFMIRLVLGVAAPKLRQIYEIAPKDMGYLLSGWNWSYTGALPLAGPIVDKFGPWISMGIGSAIWGISTMALPLAAGFTGIFIMRFVFGIGQGILIPTTSTSVSSLFPANERTRAVSVAFTGNAVGLAIGAPVAAMILSRWGWEWIFYIIGGASLVLTALWFWLYPNKTIGLVKAPASAAGADEAPPMAWLSLFRYRSTWGIAFGQCGYLYAYYFFVSWLPTYLVDARGMTILKSGFVSSLPFLAGVLGTLAGGWLGDFLIARGVSPTVSRKSIIGGGLVGSTVMVIAAAYIENVWLAVTLITLCVGSLRLATASANSLPIDLAPRTVLGSVTSIQNFFGNIGGLLAPIVTGYMVQASGGSFIGSLVVAGGMATFGAISYVFVVGDLDKDRIAPRDTIAKTGLAVPSAQTAS